jgi:hypothetical protein
MSGPFADQTPARVSGILNNIASEPHLNGHLVSTGWIDEGSPENSLFIQISAPCLQEDHHCLVFSYNAGGQIINDMSGPSQKITIREHGWFTDVAMFWQIARNHPIPNGRSPEEVFINWRDSLLLFLDTTHGSIGGR